MLRYSKPNKKRLLICSIIAISISLTGCWNYREINDAKIVLGMAIDKDMKTNNYEVTQEYINVESGVHKEQIGKVITNTGGSIFETLRGFIEPSGNYSYGAHTKVMILGKDFAKDGIVSLLDFMMRDTEFRPDTELVVSDENKAAEIFTTPMPGIPIRSMQLDNVFKYQGKIGTFEKTNIWNFIDKLSRKGFSPILPLISLEEQPSGYMPRVSGAAIFKGDKMIGELSGEDVLYYLFVDNEIENQILNVDYKVNNMDIPFALEILNNATKNKVTVKDGQIIIQINIKCDVALAEIGTTYNIIEEKERKKIEEYVQKMLNEKIINLIKKIQKQYNSDIFGFGNLIKDTKPSLWKTIEDSWDYEFEKIGVEVISDVNIKRSALTSKTLQIDAY